MPATVSGARVAIVSGKGGVGKTTVAAAVAIAAARDGRRVLLAELEDRGSVAPLFGSRALAHEEQRIAPNITGLSVVPDAALVEYFKVVYGVPKMSRALLRSKAVEFATQTAPGLRDILLIGTIMQAERQRMEGKPRFDLIVVDAPPTGRLPRLLDAPRSVAELVRAGPIKPQAQKVLDLVLDPERLHVVLVTLPEDMPVRETIEAAEALQKMDVALGPVVVNGIWPAIGALGRSPAAKLRADAAAAGIEIGDEAIGVLATVATAHSRRAALQREALAELDDELKLPRAQLPYLFTESIGRAEVEILADRLIGSGLM